MARVLVHVTVGPNEPTKAALAFFVARAVVEEGHDLVLFVAGDAVHLLTLEAANLEGKGTGRLSEHLDALADTEAEIYFSGKSALARGITQQDLVLQKARQGNPNRLVQLLIECDKVITY